MNAKIHDTGPKQPRIRDSGPKGERVLPVEVATALRADVVAEASGGGTRSISMRMLVPELGRRLRSIGGRPGIDGVKEAMRIPVRSDDVRKLNEITSELERKGVHATPGQVGSMLIHEAVARVKDLAAVRIEPIDLPLESWIHRPYIAADFCPKLRKADILVTPTEWYQNTPGPVFPVDTPDLFQYLQEHAPRGIGVEICAPEDDYREFAMYSALVIVGGFIVTGVAAPILVNLVSEYLKRRLGSRASSTEVKTEVVVRDERGTASVRLRYKGPVDEFQKRMTEALDSAKRTVPGHLPASSKAKRKKAAGR